MNRLVQLSSRIFALLAALLLTPLTALRAAGKPNIIVILADDLGYGDVHCYNPQRGKIPTPNIDRLASQGMRFTDAHSSSAVCSPSRYSLLTGHYHWRTRLQSGIVGVFGEPLIAPDRMTIGTLAKQHGYRTAAIGKWHLGWDWPIPENNRKLFTDLGGKAGGGGDNMVKTATDAHRNAWREVFSQPIPGGPTTRGFDEYFGTDIPNWPPYCFIENNRTLGIPSEVLALEKLTKNQASLQGPALPGWTFEPVLPTLTDRACDFITRQAKARTPFLLYLPLTTPHTPLAVNEAWRGKSGLNSAAADLIMETDDVVGRVLNTLEASGIAGETLVLFTSDNGFAPYVGAADLEKRGHYPSGPLRGYKFDVWEGGHREPFIVRWPGVVKPGGVCGQLVHQADILRTLADIFGVKLPDNAGEDSFSLLPLLKGEDKPIRPHAVSCAGSGLPGLRKGDWKFIPGKNPELYNLAQDIGETKNLAGDKAELVDEMKVLLEQLITDGRSTPGAKQQNDIKVRRFSNNKTSFDAKVKNTNPPGSMDFNRRIPQVLSRSAIFRQPGWCLWDPCIVKGKDGFYHLLYSRWKTSLGFDAWCTHAEIAWAVSSKPEGPYEFRGTVLPQRGVEFWDGHSVYNTCVIRIGETFHLYYTGNRGTADWKPDRVIKSNDKEWWIHRNQQRIGVATADSPGGPWKRLDQPILDVGQGFGQTIINVPVMIQKPDGGLRLYYKTLGEGPGKFGSGVFHFAADAETPTGPFRRHPEPMVNKNQLMPEVKKRFDFHIDDHFEWWQDDRYYAIVKDHDAPYLTQHGRSLLLFESPDGITWRPSNHSLVQDFSIRWDDGKDQTFERLEMPKLLTENGQPRILSLAALEQGARESFLVIVPLSVPK